jgi:MAF protein
LIQYTPKYRIPFSGCLKKSYSMKLILASESPRRRELLSLCGIKCDVLPVKIEENSRPGEAPEETALRLAREKARAAGQRWNNWSGWILAADTVVAHDGIVFGKPQDRRQAEEFLLRLRGRGHRVITGVSLLHSPEGEEMTDIAVTEVRMRAYSSAELEDYLNSGDAMDKAGAYAIQHPAFHPVESITGCYTNVVGLPVCRVFALLEKSGARMDHPLPEGCRSGQVCGFAPQLSRSE